MTEPINNEIPKQDTTESTTPPSEAQNTGHMIPKSRLDEVIQQRNERDKLNKELQAKIDAFEKSKTDAETEKLTAQNEFQKLYEAEKAKNETASSALVEKEAAIVALETKRIEDMRDNALIQLLSNAHDSQMVLTLLKANHDESMSGLIVDSKFNSEEATKLISEFASANTYLFKSNAPGSPSNAGGRMPSVKTDEAVRKEISSKFGKL